MYQLLFVDLFQFVRDKKAIIAKISHPVRFVTLLMFCNVCNVLCVLRFVLFLGQKN